MFQDCHLWIQMVSIEMTLNVFTVRNDFNFDIYLDFMHNKGSRQWPDKNELILITEARQGSQ